MPGAEELRVPGAGGRLEQAVAGEARRPETQDKNWRPACLATGIGSLPHRDPVRAVELVLRNFPEIPFWPQLPRRDDRESMYAMYSEGLPGIVLAPEGRVYVDTRRDLVSGVEQIFKRALEGDQPPKRDQALEAGQTPGDNQTVENGRTPEGDFGEFAISPDYAAGLLAFEQAVLDAAASALPSSIFSGTGTPIGGGLVAVKGQVTGPISFGFQVTDENRRPLFYHELMSEAVVQLLKLKAGWQEERLKRLAGARAIKTITFIDEPYLSSYGSAFMSLNREDVVRALGEVMSGLSGLKGVHCCGNTEWELLLETPLDILSFDAFNYAENLALYAGPIKDFLARGGVLAWGIVPTIAQDLETQTVDGLVERLEAGMRRLAGKGVPFDDLLASALVTPACGLGTQDESTAEKALALTVGVSRAMRAKYGL